VDLDLHVSGPGGKGAEARSEHNADIAYVNGEAKGMQDVVDDATGRHKARINRSADDPTQWVPCRGVKPIPEFLKKCQANQLRTTPK